MRQGIIVNAGIPKCDSKMNGVKMPVQTVSQRPDSRSWPKEVKWCKPNPWRIRARDQGDTGAMDYPRLLEQWQGGDNDAGSEVFSALNNELRMIAAARLRSESNSSLSTGDLVNEAVMKLARLDILKLQSRPHVLALASKMMRQILIDHARKRQAAKREHSVVTLTTNVAQWEVPIEMMALDMALKELQELDPQRADIVEMRFFGGMSVADISVVLEISEATVKRRWAATRAWLYNKLKH